ncbi:hypothetical protein HZA57_02240 [Candidatus Poribacteria bacterium]|nr:hypothetical protein [Candidatus Poribacteria bacterium]
MKRTFAFRHIAILAFLLGWLAPAALLAGPSILTITPDPPVQGELATIQYDAHDGPLREAHGVFIHLGANGWIGVLEPNPPMIKVGERKWEHTFTVPPDATVVDIVVNDGEGNWDNNSGADWHFETQLAVPARVSITPDPPIRGESATIRYNPAGTLLESEPKILIHLGTNDWTFVEMPQPELKKNADGTWEHTFTVYDDAQHLDVAFTAGEKKWDNNNGADWFFPTAGAGYKRIEFTPNPPVVGEEAALVYDPKGSPLAGSEMVIIHLGRNKWAKIVEPDPLLAKREDGRFEYKFLVDPDARELDFVFHDANDVWDNNDGEDWHFKTIAGKAAAKAVPPPASEPAGKEEVPAEKPAAPEATKPTADQPQSGS